MKKMLFIVLALSAGIAATAQAGKTTSAIPRAPEVKSLTVAKESTVIGYEKVLYPGRLSFSKAYRQSEYGPAFTLVYSLRISADNSFNNRQPVAIGLSRKSFDSVFTRGSSELAAKYPMLNKYVNDNNISLTDEKGWIAVVKYFNIM